MLTYIELRLALDAIHEVLDKGSVGGVWLDGPTEAAYRDLEHKLGLDLQYRFNNRKG